MTNFAKYEAQVTFAFKHFTKITSFYPHIIIVIPNGVGVVASVVVEVVVLSVVPKGKIGKGVDSCILNSILFFKLSVTEVGRAVVANVDFVIATVVVFGEAVSVVVVVVELSVVFTGTDVVFIAFSGTAVILIVFAYTNEVLIVFAGTAVVLIVFVGTAVVFIVFAGTAFVLIVFVGTAVVLIVFVGTAVVLIADTSLLFIVFVGKNINGSP